MVYCLRIAFNNLIAEYFELIGEYLLNNWNYGIDNFILTFLQLESLAINNEVKAKERLFAFDYELNVAVDTSWNEIFVIDVNENLLAFVKIFNNWLFISLFAYTTSFYSILRILDRALQ